MNKNLFFSLITMVASLLSVSCTQKADKTTPDRDSTYTTINHPEWSRNAIIYEVNLRQYTPSASIMEFGTHLPRLKELGVDILCFMSIHPISEGNKNNEGIEIKDYKAFNPEFGTINEFKEVIDSAHTMGIKIILDWIPNPTTCDSSMIDEMKFWLTDINIDGFRCDAAGEIPTDFWNEVRQQLNAVKPDLFMLAEASKPELQKHAFNMGYNLPMTNLFSEIAATSKQYTFKKDGELMRTFPEKYAIAIDSLLAVQATNYPKDSYLMNMITNHYLNSHEGTEFDRLGNLQKAFAVLTYTLPGMPLIYTGQETGMNRAFNNYKKDKAPEWEPRNEYFTFYQKLNELKHSQEALNAGEAGGKMKRFPTQSHSLYAFSREKGESKVFVVVNLGAYADYISFSRSVPGFPDMVDFFTGRKASIPDDTLLESGEFLVFVKK